MTAPKYVIFDYEGDTLKTDDENVVEQYKDYEPGVILRLSDGQVWNGEDWIELHEVRGLEAPETGDGEPKDD